MSCCLEFVSIPDRIALDQRQSAGDTALQEMYSCRACLPLDLCESAGTTSLTEYVAVMQYYKDGQVRQAWCALDAASKRRWALDDPVQHMRAQPASAWTQHAACFGLDVPAATSLSAPVARLAEDIRARLTEPEHQPAESRCEAARAGVKREREEAASVDSKRVRYVSASDVEKALAGNVPYTQIRAECLNYGQVLRGMVQVCRVWYKDAWTEGVALLNGGCEQQSLLLRLQDRAMTVLILLYSDQGDGGHWALLAARRGNQEEAVLYDGLPHSTHAKVIRDHAQGMVTYLRDEEWLSHSVKLEVAKVPLQGDAFSCGHRCIVSADHILQHVAAHACLPREIAAENLGPQHVELLIKTAANCARVKQEAQAKHDPAAAVRTPERRKRPPPDMETPPSGGSSVAERIGVRPSRRHQTPGSASSAPKHRQQELMDKHHKDGLEIAQKTGVTSGHFQKVHWSHFKDNPRKGHFRAFLVSLGAGASMVCAACAELQHDPPRKPADAGQLVPVVPDAEDDGIGPVGQQVRRPGRPRKTEPAGVRFNLGNFLAAKRRGVYRETPHSLTRSRAEYFCAACSRSIKFGSLTDQNKVFAHERSQRHRKGLLKLRQLGLVAGDPLDEAVDDAAQEDAPAIQDQPAAPAAPARANCDGVSVSEPGTPLHRVEGAIKTFCCAGQPRTLYAEKEHDPLGNVILEMHPEIRLRAKTCKRERPRRELARTECLQQARDKGMLRALSQKAFDVDLITLAYKAAHMIPEDVHSFIADIRSKDYYVLGFAGQNLDDLVKSGTGLQLVRRIRTRFDTTPAWRKSDALKLYLKSYLTSSSLYHDGDVQLQAHTALSNALASAIQDGKTRSLELDLAARVAAGELRTDAVIEQLVTSFLLRSKDSLQRPHRSRHLTDVGAMADALGTLGRRSEIDQLVRRFGVNPRAIPRLSLDHSILPKAFGSLSSESQLKQAYGTAACHLRAASKRLHIMVDETVWSPAAEQCRGFLGDDGKDTDVILGGYWSQDQRDCWHYLDAETWAEQTVEQGRLARLTLHFVISRPDHPRWGFDTCTLPRKPKEASAEEMLQLCGQYLDIVTKAAGGLPPQSVAFDGATSNNLLNRCLLGLVEDMSQIPFFKHCQLENMPLKFWPYRRLLFRSDDLQKSFELLGFNGAYHVQKRFSLQFCGSGRKIRMGSLFCDSTAMLQFQLPHKVYGMADNMSDKAAVSRLTPPYLGRSCLLLGQHLAALVSALLASATTASPAFSKKEHCLNGMTAFYLLCLHTACNQATYKDEWQKHSLSVPTLRNTMGLAGHAVHASMAGAEPRCIQELGIERYFSAIKAPYRGSPSVKDGVFGAARHQLQEVKELQAVSDASLAKAEPAHSEREPLSLDDVKKCSGLACANAIQLMAWATEDGTTEDIFYILNHWFKNHSQALFRGILEYDQCEELEVEAEEIIDNELDGEVSTSDAQGRLQLLMAVHDRAAAEEEVRKHLQELEHQRGEAGGGADSTQPVPEPSAVHGQLPEAQMEPDYDAKQPRSLQCILRMTVQRAGKAEVLDCGEAPAAGPRAVLRRVHLLMPAMRQFIRYVRLEENILSQGVIENGLPGSNKWNQREHLLALARRNANLVRTRLTRLEMWSQAQASLARTVEEKTGYTKSDGLHPVAEYKPCDCESTSQILAVRIDGRVQVCITLCVFRGSIVRNPKTQAQRVRTSKPIPVPLQAEYAKLLHIVRLDLDDSRQEYLGSCLSDVLMVSPLNIVLGEVHGQVSASSLRIHVKLSEASLAALKQLEKIDIPMLRDDAMQQVREQAAVPGPETAAAVSFNDRSFMRSSLDSCKIFIHKMLQEYKAKGAPVEDSDGLVTLRTKAKVAVSDLIDQVPSYFLKLLPNDKGYRFSSAVFSHLKVLLPDRRAWDTVRESVSYKTNQKKSRNQASPRSAGG